MRDNLCNTWTQKKRKLLIAPFLIHSGYVQIECHTDIKVIAYINF